MKDPAIGEVLRELKRAVDHLASVAHALAPLVSAVEVNAPASLTVAKYLKTWIAHREARGLSSARDSDVRLRRYALPELGKMRLSEVRPSNVRQLVYGLRARIGTGADSLETVSPRADAR